MKTITQGITEFVKDLHCDCDCVVGLLKTEVLDKDEMAKWKEVRFECKICQLKGQIEIGDKIEKITDPKEIFFITECPNCKHSTEIKKN